MVTEVGAMAYRWPEDTDFALWELDVLDRDCPACGRMMHICDHRYRRVHTLDGPVQLICKLNHCPDPTCPGHAKTKSPELEITIALPQVAIGWDVFCWIGHRRCSRHMAIPLIRSELRDDYAIALSEDAIDGYIRRYQVMLAARQQDAESLRRHYESAEIILCIDGLQPEKGHETLYVVRELTRKRVWFAEPLLSATEDEVRRLIKKAKDWAESLGTPVGLWVSDQQDAFVKGIAAEFPDVPHRYCDNHFLRDVAKPVLEADSHAKVQMRKKVRGLRTIEQAVLRRPKAETKDAPTPDAPVTVIAEVAATLEAGTEDITERQEKFEALIDRFEATADPIQHGMATVMLSFLAGLFVGEQEYERVRDNLDLERWFRLPKSHERRIHGHRHAGIRLVLDGPTLVPALDPHAAR